MNLLRAEALQLSLYLQLSGNWLLIEIQLYQSKSLFSVINLILLHLFTKQHKYDNCLKPPTNHHSSPYLLKTCIIDKYKYFKRNLILPIIFHLHTATNHWTQTQNRQNHTSSFSENVFLKKQIPNMIPYRYMAKLYIKFFFIIQN